MTSESQQLADELAVANQAIEELQTKLAFQEHTIDALNDALSSQQRQLEKMEFQSNDHTFVMYQKAWAELKIQKCMANMK